MNDDVKVVLKKLLICAYIIIALLAINTIILFTSNVDITTNKENNSMSDNNEYDVSMFDTVDTSGAIGLFESSDTQVIYIGRSTCGYCVKFLPVLQKAQKEFGYKTKYLDITTVTTEEQQKSLFAKDNEEGFLTKNFGATPMVILVRDGKLIDGWVGYAEYDEFTQFLRENGFKD